jgi:mRNA interferase MazF
LVKEYIPSRGEVIWINCDPQQTGHEQKKYRPALVLSSEKYNKLSGLVIACPITSKKKARPFDFEVLIPSDLEVKGVILADQIRSFDWKARDVKFMCKLPDDLRLDVIDKIAALLED